MTRDLLLEIGTEELPARFIPRALEQLEERTAARLRDVHIAFSDVRVYGTPRRLAVLVRGVSEEQAPRTEAVKGPAARIAFDASGTPTAAAVGFARSQGVPVDALVVRETAQGAYVFAVKTHEGRPAVEVLPELLRELIVGLEFPKAMRWGDLDLRFARPIRWLVALFGQEVLPVSLEGVPTGRTSRGHRFAPGSAAVEIVEPAQYADRLRAAHVIVDPEERRQKIREAIAAQAEQCRGRVLEDDELLDEVTFLVEDVAAIHGSFRDEYLTLPEPVLITPMKEHQRYFPVVGPDGRLLARFIAVINGPHGRAELVRVGNEKVLGARLADAKFFFDEDVKRPLAERVEGLRNIVFQERLGTVYDKVQRVVRLTGLLADWARVTGDAKVHAVRAATLCKADLLTHMVYEFPELHGIMGREYARRSGEAPPVAEAIWEHTLPRGAGDRLPETRVGALVAVADKLDTLAGCFAAGLIPTGSQDPYALRRQALGILRIAIDQRLDVSLEAAIGEALVGYRETLGEVDREVPARLLDFFKLRMQGLLRERGIRPDLIDAALAAGIDRVPAALDRAEALAELVGTTAFRDVLTVFQRAANLAAKGGAERVDPTLFVEPAEKTLHEALARVAPRVSEHLGQRAYGQAVEVLAQLKEPLDQFFASVLVMDERAAVRDNRLALLRSIVALTEPLGDLRKVEAG